MTKATLVFQSPGTFLSFPVLSPLSFAANTLDFSNALTDPHTWHALMDFSIAVNQCARSSVWQDDGGAPLWQQFSAWLDGMTLAQSQLDPADQAAYAAARQLLVVVGDDGLERDSAVLVAYKQCRDAVFAAQQAYAAGQVTANSGDAQALAVWQSTDGPRLAGVVEAAIADWDTTGRKLDVETAQGVIERADARNPATAWAAWRKACNPNVDFLTDPVSGASFAPTGFAPVDLVQQAWNSIELAQPEIAAMVRQAPAALASMLGQTDPSTIESISLELRSAELVRPWCNGEIFDARFWTFNDGSLLSDGNTPPAGKWPAYVEAVIFMRKVQVNYIAKPVLEPIVVRRPFPFVGGVGPVVAVRPPPVLPAAEAVQRVVPTTMTITPHAIPAAAGVAIGTTMPRPDPAALRRLEMFTYRGAGASAGAPPPVAAEPAAPGADAPSDNIDVLAFICRTLPRCPNPDPALAWSAASTH